MFVKTNLTDDQVISLACYARSKGCTVIDPRTPWKQVSKEDRKRLVQYALDRLIKDVVKEVDDALSGASQSV